MLRSHGLLPAVISISNRGNFKYFSMRMYQWNPIKSQLETTKNWRGYVVAVAYLITLVVYMLKRQTLLQWQAVQGYLGCMLLLIAFLNVFHNLNKDLIASFINGLLQYEEDTNGNATSTSKGSDKLSLSNLIILFSIVVKYSLDGVAVCMTVMSILLPLSPFNLLHALVSDSMQVESYYGLARLSLCWAVLVGPCHYILWKRGLVMLELTTVLDYLIALYATFMAVRLYVRQMACVGLRAASANYLKAISYRKIQLLTGVYNELHSQSVQLLMGLGLWVAFTVCTFLSIRSSSKGDLLVLAFSLTVSTNCGLGILVFFGLGAKVFSESNTALVELKSVSNYYRRSLWYRKLVRSFPVQKIKISYCNFFEAMTPLIIEEACVSNAITLLLIT